MNGICQLAVSHPEGATEDFDAGYKDDYFFSSLPSLD